MKLYIQSLFMLIILMLLYPLCIDYNLYINGINNTGRKMEFVCSQDKLFLLLTPIMVPALAIVELKLSTNDYKVIMDKNKKISIEG